MQIGVLGRLRLVRADSEADLGPHKQRAVLAALALHTGDVVSVDRLADLVWGDRPPAAVSASVHSYVAALRRLLEPDRSMRGAAEILVREASGYRLRLPSSGLDAAEFTRTVDDIHRRTPTDVSAPTTSDPTPELAELLRRVDAGLGLWRGTPYAELDGHPDVVAERTRLEELRWHAVQDRARILLALGRPSEATTALAGLVTRDPLREDATALLALSLARSGRPADALQTLRDHREALADELGIDPGPALRELEVAVLRQDASVVPDARRTAPAPRRNTVVAAAPDRATSPEPVTTDDVPGDPPLVGRAGELGSLVELLDSARTGRPRFAVLVGEAGIGKTRLIAELSAVAQRRGFLVLSGHCSSDEGAPPLWPWVRVLRTLAAAMPEVGAPSRDRLLTPAGDGSPDRFRLFDDVLAAVADAARSRPVLLTLDDLHWADASTLRLVQHLVEECEQGRILVAVTRRPFPEPTGALADLAAAMARHHVLRLELDGLSTASVRALAEGSGRPDLGADEAQRLCDRTGGNPFFVGELLRRQDGAAGGEPHGVPAAVADVIAARVAQLPDASRRLLGTAAALHRHLDPALLAALEGSSPDEILDGLEPAIAAGLIVVDPVDQALRFSHALVKDAIEATEPALRRQRRHARIAEYLSAHDDAPERLSEVARHWLRSGPAHAGRAWRAAARAAAYATSLRAHEEAAELLSTAVTVQRADPDASRLDRYDLSMALCVACRAAADSAGQRAAAAAAMALAADDLERLALAAVAGSEGALWSNRPEGEVDPATLDALHRAADQLPGADTELRCQVFLALSRELFWAPGRREAEAYAEQGLAMARRLDAPRLQARGCHALLVSSLRPANLAVRRALAAESVRCARSAQDVELEAVSLFWQAVMAGEGGWMTEREEAVSECRRLVGQHRLRYLQVMLGCYEVPWLALQGRFERADDELAEAHRWAAQAQFPFRDEAIAAADAWLALWQGRAGALLDRFQALDESSPTDVSTTVVLLMLRSGRLDDAAALLDERPVPLVVDDFAVTFDLSIGAEAALLLRRPQLAAAIYPLMSGWSGRAASAGTGAPLGPVDAFLALAAAAVGETALATTHADEAARLCHEWELAPVAAWLAELRARFAF